MRKALPLEIEEKYEASSSVPQIIEFVPPGTSKAKALEMLGERLNISASEMIAFGDESNDIGLLEFAGMGVAKGNASESVKEIANCVCESNANDGVARFLEQLLSHEPTRT